MDTKKVLTPFYDLNEKSVGKSGFFFLEHILKARCELHLESAEDSCDQELNIYIAGLLNSLLHGGNHITQKPYISPFDQDVRHYLHAHPGFRNVYTVYRENADTGLLLSALFSGHEHCGSYHRRVFNSKKETGRIALYYEIAASALGHLQGNNHSLIEVLEALSKHIETIMKIIQYASSNYFDLMERLSEGTMFHLQRELDCLDAKKEYQKMMDDFLLQYGKYMEHPTEDKKKVLVGLIAEIKRVKHDFKIDL